jgi:hypothetical protein
MAHPVETGHHPHPAADLTLHGRLRHLQRGSLSTRMGPALSPVLNMEAGMFATLRDV